MFPCIAGRCLHLLGISLLWLLPTSCVLAVESSRVVINPMITLGKLAAALVVVLGVFWVFARVMRQVQGGHGGVHQNLKIVGALSVGQREKVIVVQAGDDQIVLGVTSTQINTLHVLDSPLSQQTLPADSLDFRKKLSAAMKRQVPVE